MGKSETDIQIRNKKRHNFREKITKTDIQIRNKKGYIVSRKPHTVIIIFSFLLSTWT